MKKHYSCGNFWIPEIAENRPWKIVNIGTTEESEDRKTQCPSARIKRSYSGSPVTRSLGGETKIKIHLKFGSANWVLMRDANICCV